MAATVIDCESSGRGFYFHSGEEANSVLAGFTIKRGRVWGNPAKGGGILCSGASPMVENCIITNNQAYGNHGTSDSIHGKQSYGGGLFISGSNLIIIGCTISNNSAIGGNGRNANCSPMDPPQYWIYAGMGGIGHGGGIYCSSGSLTIIDGCVISNNTSRGGAGGQGFLECQNGGGGSGKGGGIYSTNLAITNCSIKNNRALGGTGGTDDCPHYTCGSGGDGWGGGIYGSGIISDNIINGNTAQGAGPPGPDTGRVYGGGIYCLSGSQVMNCLITNNGGSSNYAVYGGGIHGMGVSISNCTICYNLAEADPTESFGGVYGSGTSTITNCILWGNGDDIAGCSATYSCIEDGDAGVGNISADPCFVTGPLGDYYLSQLAAGQAVDSPCVDTGSDTAANLGMDIFTTRTDEVGDMGIVDMGYHYPAIIEYGNPDIDGDGDIDFFDYAWLAMGLFYGTSHQIPKGSVVVDGDLSDWPGSVEWIELDKVYSGSPNDLIDARFALQWDGDTDKVYAAVVVNDTNHVFLDEYVTWDASDRIEVYSQGDAENGTGWYGIYDAAQQYYVAPDTIGGSWATWALGEVLDEDAGLEYVVRVIGNFIIYEVGVPMLDNYGSFSGGQTVVTELHAGHVVGFDIVLCTRWDTTNFGMLSENLMMGKYKDAGKFAKYLLVDEIFSADMDGNGANNYADLGILVDSWLDCYVTKANHPQPAHQTKCVDPNVTLSWVPGEGALLHDVYFSTDANAVACAGHLSPEFMGTVSEAYFDPCGLELDTMYYWRIDEVGAACSIQGKVWSFKTFLDPNLISWWKFDEGSGTIVYDSAGENDGTIYGAAWTTGQIDGALDFDGVDDYVDCGATFSSVTGNVSKTIMAWVKSDTSVYLGTTFAGGGRVLTLYKDHGSSGFSLYAYGDPAAWRGLYIGAGNANQEIDSEVPVIINQWTHVTLVQEGVNVYIYVNGLLENTTSDAAGPMIGNPDSADIGCFYSGANSLFDGSIDDVQIYDRALSTGEIMQLYQDGLN